MRFLNPARYPCITFYPFDVLDNQEGNDNGVLFSTNADELPIGVNN